MQGSVDPLKQKIITQYHAQIHYFKPDFSSRKRQEQKLAKVRHSKLFDRLRSPFLNIDNRYQDR
jgi:hypothetical protein